MRVRFLNALAVLAAFSAAAVLPAAASAAPAPPTPPAQPGASATIAAAAGTTVSPLRAEASPPGSADPADPPEPSVVVGRVEQQPDGSAHVTILAVDGVEQVGIDIAAGESIDRLLTGPEAAKVGSFCDGSASQICIQGASISAQPVNGAEQVAVHVLKLNLGSARYDGGLEVEDSIAQAQTGGTCAAQAYSSVGSVGLALLFADEGHSSVVANCGSTAQTGGSVTRMSGPAAPPNAPACAAGDEYQWVGGFSYDACNARTLAGEAGARDALDQQSGFPGSTQRLALAASAAAPAPPTRPAPPPATTPPPSPPAPPSSTPPPAPPRSGPPSRPHPRPRASRAVLGLTKRASARSVRRGNKVSFRLTVTNRSAIAARRVRVCDMLPASIGAVISAPRHATLVSGRLCVTVGTLYAHHHKTIVIRVRIDRGARPGRSINHAIATAANARSVKAQRAFRVLRTRVVPHISHVTG